MELWQTLKSIVLLLLIISRNKQSVSKACTAKRCRDVLVLAQGGGGLSIR